MRRRRCFAMLLAAALALIITSARALPTAMTAEAFPIESSTEAVSSSDKAFTSEGPIPYDASHYGGFHYGATESTEADQETKQTDEAGDATGTSAALLHRPLLTATDYEQSGGTRYDYNTMDNGNGKDTMTDFAASEENKTKTEAAELPKEKYFWKMFNDDLDTVELATKDRDSASAVTPLPKQTVIFSTPAPYVSVFGSVSEPLIEARADDTDDEVPSRLRAAAMSSSSSSDPPPSPEVKLDVYTTGDDSKGHTVLSGMSSETETGTAATYHDVVSEDVILPSTYSTTTPAKEVPEQSGTAGEGIFVQEHEMATIEGVTSEKSHIQAPIGKEDLASGDVKVDTANSDSQKKPDDSYGEHKDGLTASASAEKPRDSPVIVSPRDEQGDTVSSSRGNPIPQAGQSGSLSPTLEVSDGAGVQGVPPDTAQVDHLMARAGDKPDSEKASQPALSRAELPKTSGSEAGRGAEAPKPVEVPRISEVPAEGNSKVTRPESPRAEQPKASAGGGGDPTNKAAEVPRSAETPAAENSKVTELELPRAEQPKAGGGESGRGAEPPNKPVEAPRISDDPAAGNSKASQPESPRAEQPKASVGGGGDPQNKAAEVPRSVEAPAAGNSKASQPESPRAEQPKASGSWGGDPKYKAAELPRSAAENSKVSQPESPRAEQPKATVGEGGREDEPAEAPRSSDVPAGGNNKASQLEPPRAEQNKAHAPGKENGSPEAPRSEQQNPPAIVMPVTNKDSEGRSESQPEIPRSDVPKNPVPPSAGKDGGEAKGGKAPETVVIVEDKKEGKEEVKKPGPTKMVETTESETHISIDDKPEKKPTDVVIPEGKPHDAKKDKGEETVLVVKNVTVEVVPEGDVPDSKPGQVVPAAPPKEAVVYPPAQTTNHPNPPHQPPSAYQPYQPYQAPPYHQPSEMVFYVPQPVYQPAAHTSYMPGPPSPYQPIQHMGPTYQYQQPYVSYQQTPYDLLYQPSYAPVSVPAYPQVQHTAYYPAHPPRYGPPQRVIYVSQYQVPRVYPSSPAYSRPYGTQHNYAQISAYQPPYPTAANVPYAVHTYRNKGPYYIPMKRPHDAHQVMVLKPRHEHPAFERPGHEAAAYGGHKRHVDEQAHTSQLHFPPVVAHPQNAAVPNHASPPKKYPAVHHMPLSPFQNHAVRKPGAKLIFNDGHVPKVIPKRQGYGESHIPEAYWRSTTDEVNPAAEYTEQFEVSEDGELGVKQALYTGYETT
ncbi:uncharacterized protein LOC142786784 isoform X2 [Rhipicephalus microplus]|uniref:uncharacterized protein LOC142786784 isoform X2 n=1 Tax=Rhipicephalus microplus TaxID=6941 RepID=UPI003F6BB799